MQRHTPGDQRSGKQSVRIGQRALAFLGAVPCIIGLALALSSAAFSAPAEETIRIGYTDPMSGPFSQVGQQNRAQLQYNIDYINAKGGALGKKFALVTFDNKSQPSEALMALKSMTDQSIPVVLQVSGSNIAAALIEGVEKHNARNPDNRILYLNAGSVATELTNEKCSFWHFRFEANADQKAMMLVRAIPPEVKKVYLLNQDYLFGQSLQRGVEGFLAKFRPDIAIAGNELIPLGRVKDFSPYISKIKASGAQALITGNWGPDMTLLIKAGMDAGLDVKYYTLYAHLGGGPTAIGSAGEGRVFSLMPFNENLAAEQGDPAFKEWVAQWRATHNFDFIGGQARTMFEYLQAAIRKAGAVDPLKIAQAMEGMARPDMLGQDSFMR
ncbi:MAG: branched-chain amino acid ABC transporter substrate-binding protein, partial [Acetobacteraceae bacterium]|nr:branched-chain amino acid ABC transporter substrate-binding protein [Acetobacteraceae bacterium]